MEAKKNQVTRRKFIKTSASAAAVAFAAPYIIPKSIRGANDQINLAVIGIRGRGKSHISKLGAIPGVKIHTICDCDENLFPKRVKELEEKFGYAPKTEYDLRKVYDNPEIDAVTNAMPNFWHALATIWAAQAGKHVYVEKPSCHTIWEGQKMIEAARKYKVLIQVGYQNRSRENTKAGIHFLHEGGIGKVYMVRAQCFRQRWNIGKYPDGPMSEGEIFTLTTDGKNPAGPYTPEYLNKVHYDLWTGPATMRPFNRNRFHYNWHWQWEYGNGDTGNQGPHQFDVALWGLNKKEHPATVYSKGGVYVFDSQQDTPNIQTSVFQYADETLFEFTTRGLFTNREGKMRVGVIFYGEKGYLEIDSGGNWASYFGYENEPGPSSESKKEESDAPMSTVGVGDGDHYMNFIKSLRSGKQEDLNCEIEVGHKSAAISHMANISYLLQKELTIHPTKEEFTNSKKANKMLKRANLREPYVIREEV